MNWQDLRKLFPIAARRVHLNHAGVSPVSLRVAETVKAFIDHATTLEPGEHARWEARAEAARAGFARLVGAHTDEIAFVKNTSEGLSLVAAGLDWHDGDNVIAVDGEYPANVYPWWSLRREGVATRMIAKAPGDVGVDDVAALVDDRTRLVAVSFVDWSTGGRVDLASIGAFCRERGILLCVDGIQGVGALRLDVEKCGIDFLAVGGHKWLLAPEGCGCLYVSRRVTGSLRSVLHGWKSVSNADTYLPYHFDPRSDAAKLEPGTPSVLSTVALGAAIDLLHEIGPEAVEQRLFALNDRFAAGLRARGATILSPWQPERRSGILVFRLGDDPDALAGRLRDLGFTLRARGGGVRVAPHCYLDEDDVDRFLAAVDIAR
jgi:selenocysteine lyase/cysteine desulfurase